MKSFLFKNDDAINKRFTNWVTRSVLEIRSPHFYARPSQARAVQKNIALRISQCGPSNPVSKSLVTPGKGYFSLNDFMHGQRATGKIQRNNYHHGNCGPSLTGKTSSVSLIFTHRTHRNVKNR